MSTLINVWLELFTKWGNCSIQPSNFLINIFTLFNFINFLYNTRICVFLNSFCPILSYVMNVLINVNVSRFKQFIIFPELWVQVLRLFKVSHAFQRFWKIFFSNEGSSIRKLETFRIKECWRGSVVESWFREDTLIFVNDVSDVIGVIDDVISSLDGISMSKSNLSLFNSREPSLTSVFLISISVLLFLTLLTFSYL